MSSHLKGQWGQVAQFLSLAKSGSLWLSRHLSGSKRCIFLLRFGLQIENIFLAAPIQIWDFGDVTSKMWCKSWHKRGLSVCRRRVVHCSNSRNESYHQLGVTDIFYHSSVSKALLWIPFLAPTTNFLQTLACTSENSAPPHRAGHSFERSGGSISGY